MRKLLITLVVLLILCLASYFVFSLNNKIENKSPEGINAIPHHAIAILRVQNPTEKWKTLTQSNYGKHLLEMPEIKDFSNSLSAFQQAIEPHEILTGVFHDQPVFLSAHMTAKKSYSFLLVGSCSGKHKQDFLKLAAEQLPQGKISSRKYEECQITDLQFPTKKQQFSIVFEQNLVVISSSPILIEDAILQLKHRVPLHQKKEFAKLYKTADLELDANLFLNYPQLGDFLNVFGSKNSKPQNKFKHFGNWMEVDLKIVDNGIMMNGFSFINDSSATFLSNLKSLAGGKLNVSAIVPDNVGFLSFVGFENYEKYHKNYKTHLQEKQELYQFEKNIDKINQNHNINLEEDLYSWIGKEFCFFITQGDHKDPMHNACVAIQSNNIELAIEKLKKIEIAAGGKKDSAEFMNHAIYNLGLTNFLKLTLGDFFTGSKRTYYTVIQDYVVFGNDVSNLKNVINSYLRGKTLIKNKDFNQFYENFSDQSSYFVYLNPKKAKNFWSYFLTEKTADFFVGNQKTLDNFEAIGFQTVANDNLFYTNIYSNYKVIDDEEKVSLIECVIDTSYSDAPWIVTNHYTKEKEILLQDDQLNLYLINNVGKILWKRKMSNKIVGEVHLIDRYKNKKFQYLFGTGDHLHLIDRNGKDVSGYPVKLKNKQTKGIAVLDYDKNKRYRILVPSGRRLTNYSEEGKVVKGWDFKSAKANISNTPELLQSGKKDYIVFNDDQGHLYTLNRKGENRITYNTTLPANRNRYETLLNSGLKNSGVLTTDTNGTIFFLKMNDELETVTTRAFTKSHEFSLNHCSSSSIPDVFYRDESEVYAYKLSKNQVLKIKNVDFIPAFGVNTHLINEKQEYIVTMTDRPNNKIHAYDREGKAIKNFPMEGNSEVLIEDLNNDGHKEMIIGNKQGSLFIYSIF